MAKNSGETRGSMVAAIQSGMQAVGATITGASASVSSPADIEQVSYLDKLREIGADTRDSVTAMATTLAETLAWDKEKFRREMDAAREREKEMIDASATATIPMPTKEQATGGFGPGLLLGLAALAGIAKALNVDEILRLPQQLKSLRTMASFFRGVMRLATFGFGPAILRGLRSFLKSFDLKLLRTKVLGIFDPVIKRLNDFKTRLSGRAGPITRLIDSVTDFFRGIGTRVTAITKFFRTNRAIGFVTKAVSDAFKVITRTLRPIFNTIKGLFSGAGLGILDKILGPLKLVFRTIGRLFLPITLILGVIDGVQGFMKEFGETGSILDGIRGAVVGIVDGFIGGLVRLIGSAIEWILGFFGLDNLGKSINEKINQLMDSFLGIIGGITDLISGLFSFDGERIMKGLGAIFSGVGGFFANILSLPIDLAVNFIKDLFGFGNPDKPFSLKTWLFGGDGEKGLIGRIWDSIKSVFTLPEGGFISGFVDKIINIGRVIKAIGVAGLAAAGALLPGGEGPGEAFKRKFDEVMNGGAGDVTTNNLTTDNSSGDMSTTTNNTKTMTEGSTTQGGNVTIIDNSNKQNNASNQSSTTHQTLSLDTSVDRQYERDAWAFAGP